MERLAVIPDRKQLPILLGGVGGVGGHELFEPVRDAFHVQGQDGRRLLLRIDDILRGQQFFAGERVGASQTDASIAFVEFQMDRNRQRRLDLKCCVALRFFGFDPEVGELFQKVA